MGVPSENVREVMRTSVLTPLPRAPAFILGVASHRGEVLPVMDLLRFLGKGEGILHGRTRLFVGVFGTSTTAVLVDTIVGLKKFSVAKILPVPMGGDVAAEHLMGIVQTDELWTLLNFSKLMGVARQRAIAR